MQVCAQNKSLALLTLAALALSAGCGRASSPYAELERTATATLASAGFAGRVACKAADPKPPVCTFTQPHAPAVQLVVALHGDDWQFDLPPRSVDAKAATAMVRELVAELGPSGQGAAADCGAGLWVLGEDEPLRCAFGPDGAVLVTLLDTTVVFEMLQAGAALSARTLAADEANLLARSLALDPRSDPDSLEILDEPPPDAALGQLAPLPVGP